MAAPRPEPLEVAEAKRARLTAILDSFGTDFEHWIAATAREHTSNYLALMREPDGYAELLHFCHESTRATILWCIDELGLVLPPDLRATPEQFAQRQAERALQDEARQARVSAMEALRGIPTDTPEQPGERLGVSGPSPYL
jgi:hypothetical protein